MKKLCFILAMASFIINVNAQIRITNRSNASSSQSTSTSSSSTSSYSQPARSSSTTTSSYSPSTSTSSSSTSSYSQPARSSSTTTSSYSQMPTTQAVPISNGCGAASAGTLEKGATVVGREIDKAKYGSDAGTKSCDQHDKDYYNGVPKKTADDNFEKRSPTMGAAVKGERADWNTSTTSKVSTGVATTFSNPKERSTESYNEAQQDRKTSQELQSTWEKEHKQSLDKENYRVEPNKTQEFLEKNKIK